MVNWNCY